MKPPLLLNETESAAWIGASVDELRAMTALGLIAPAWEDPFEDPPRHCWYKPFDLYQLMIAAHQTNRRYFMEGGQYGDSRNLAAQPGG